MTTPTERTRNLIQAGAFLKELRADESLPEHHLAESRHKDPHANGM